MCDEFVRSRWLSISQGFVPILATCMSFKKWVHAVQFDRGEPARAAVRKSCRISFHTGMQHVRDGTPLHHAFYNSFYNSVERLLESWHTILNTILHTLLTIGQLMMQAFCMMEAPLLIIVSSISTDTSVTPKAHAIHGFTLVQGATLCTI